MAEEQLGFDMPEEGSHKPETSGKADKKAAGEAPAGPRKLADDEVFDYITGDRVVKLTEAEKVRQHIARSLVQQYGIDPHDMKADFSIPVINADGRKSRRRASIAIFEHGKKHELANLRRVVVTKPRPKDSRTVSKIRTYAHAKAQIDEVGQLMLAAPDCKIPVPTLTAEDRERIADTVRQAYSLRDEADCKEDQALARLEEAVAQHTGVAG